MPRIIDYPTLKQHTLLMLQRTTDAEADALFDGWVSLAEADFAPNLRAPWIARIAEFNYQERETEPFEYLPPTFAAMGTVICLETAKFLEPITPLQVADWLTKPSGSPSVYYVSGYTIRLYPRTTQLLHLWMEYYSRQEALSIDNPITNDIIVNAPAIYLYGVLKHAALHYGMEQVSMWDQQFQVAIQQSNGTDFEWRRGAGAKVNVRN